MNFNLDLFWRVMEVVGLFFSAVIFIIILTQAKELWNKFISFCLWKLGRKK